MIHLSPSILNSIMCRLLGILRLFECGGGCGESCVLGRKNKILSLSFPSGLLPRQLQEPINGGRPAHLVVEGDLPCCSRGGC
jgi:hypothetical protein